VTVLVTGAAGFVGSHVVRQLIESNQEVAALVRPGSPRHRLDGVENRVQIVEADLEQPDAIASQLARLKPQTCIHAAWFAEPGAYLHSQRNLDSLRSSLSLLEALAGAGCQHVVGVGTCFEYAMGPHKLTEDSPTRPFTLYAAAKLAFSLVASQRAPQLGMGMAWARLFYIYGPFEDERRFIPAAINTLSAGREFSTAAGNLVRDYMHVEDVASGLCAISSHRLPGAFNVCSGDPSTIAALVQTVGELVGRPELIRPGALPPRKGDPPYVCGDNQRLSSEAHWSQRYTISSGLAQTIAWWNQVPAR
jgi:dTDP-6-deoxy-L-talose 4-dehydrogenase (NAD+)